MSNLTEGCIMPTEMGDVPIPVKVSTLVDFPGSDELFGDLVDVEEKEETNVKDPTPKKVATKRKRKFLCIKDVAEMAKSSNMLVGNGAAHLVRGFEKRHAMSIWGAATTITKMFKKKIIRKELVKILIGLHCGGLSS